jgi:hypothetical protein
MPFGPAGRDAGYWWETSMRQVEVSRTIVFDATRRARWFYEALIGDNLDIGRPDNVEIIFGRRIQRSSPPARPARIQPSTRLSSSPTTAQAELEAHPGHRALRPPANDQREKQAVSARPMERRCSTMAGATLPRRRCSPSRTGPTARPSCRRRSPHA